MPSEYFHRRNIFTYLLLDKKDLIDESATVKTAIRRDSDENENGRRGEPLGIFHYLYVKYPLQYLANSKISPVPRQTKRPGASVQVLWI